MFCTKCGTEMNQDSKFCPSCGYSLNGDKAEDKGQEAISFLKKFASFDSMVTPIVIKALYWVLIAVVVLAGLATMLANFLGGLLILVLGPIGVRVNFELLIIIFEIHKNLVAMNKKISENK